MAVELKIDPFRESREIFPPRDDPAHALAEAGFKPVLAEALTRLVLSDRSSAEEIASRLDEAFTNQVPNAFRRALAMEEVRRSYSEVSPVPIGKVLKSGGFEGTSTSPIDFFGRFALPLATEDSLRGLFSGRQRLIRYLTKLHRIPVRGEEGKILKLLQDIRDLYRSNAKDKAQKVYSMAKSAIGNPDFTVPSDKSGSLYFLTHLPREIRYAVHDVLFVNNSIDYLDRTIPNTAPKDLRVARDAVKRVLVAKAFSNHHWDTLFSNLGDASGLVLEVGKDAARAEREIVALGRMRRGAEAVELEHGHSKARREEAWKASRSFRAEFLQHHDTGHTFPAGNFDLSHSVFRRELASKGMVKDGTQALIFEDDPRQAESYRRMFNIASRLRAPADGSLVTDSIERVLEIARRKRSSISVYLLDVSQPQDPFAGLRLMKELIRTLAARLPPLNQTNHQSQALSIGGHPKYITLRLWSSSPELLDSCKADIIELVSRDPILKERVNISGSGGYRRIELQFGYKSDLSFIRHI